MSLRQFSKRFSRQVSWCVNVYSKHSSRAYQQLRCMSGGGGVIDPPDFTPPIPEYVDRGEDETLEKKKARLLYQSRKRGMTENGLLLSTFASLYLDKLNEVQLKMYDSLINKPSNDWEIYYWMIGNKPTPPEYDNEIMDMLKNHARNEDRSVRLQQPDLYA